MDHDFDLTDRRTDGQIEWHLAVALEKFNYNSFSLVNYF